MKAEDRAEIARKNSHRSTGPRTSAGKARSSRNAVKHGLAVPLAGRHGHCPEAQALAHEILREGGLPERVRTLAYAVAEAEMDLVRVSEVRTALCVGLLAGSSEGSDHGCSGFREHIAQLERLERYDRRARSRRKSAVRRLMAETGSGA